MEYLKEIRKKVGHDRVIMVGAAVIIYKDGKILLQQRKDNNTWAPHGGAVEIAEKVEDAAKRELNEETGLTANSLDLFGVFSGERMLHEYPNGDKVSMVVIAYLCNDFSGELKPQKNEILELKWFDFDKIPMDINPPDVDILKEFVERMK